MKPDAKPTFSWESVYRATLDGRPFPWEIRSQMALRVGHAFFLPLTQEVLVNPAFARPIWKPRSKPNFVRVEVESVDGETLVLRSV